MRWNRFHGVSGVLLCLAVALSAQGAPSTVTPPAAADFVLESWLTPSGLPQDSVQAIAQTPDGYLWVGTKGGLARFDGVRFTRFGLAEGLQGLEVVSLVEDGEGGLWIGTFGGGLSRWHAGRISTLTKADGLAHDDTLVLAAAEPGAVWVGGSGGLQHWGVNGFTRIGEAAGLPTDEVRALAVGRGGGLWVALLHEGLFWLRAGRAERVGGPAGRQQIVASTLLVDDRGALWAGIGNGYMLRRHDGAWSEFNPSHGLPTSFVYCLAQGAPGEIWAGSHEQGLFVFRDGSFHAAATMPKRLVPSIRSVFRSRDGLIWVGASAGGLGRLAPRRVMAGAVGEPEPRGQVNGLAEDPTERLWVTTWGGGLHRGDIDAWQRLQGAKSVDESPFLLTALRVRSGTIYFGGLRRLHWLEPGATELAAIDLADTITALGETSTGTLWAGTRGGAVLQLENGALQPVIDGPLGGVISGIASAPDGVMWIATRGAGLCRWEAGQLRRWTTADGLPTNLLRGLHRDAEGTLWMGTLGGGIAWMRAGQLHAVDSRQGLGDDVVSQILEDDADHLWLGGNHGIRRVSKRELIDVASGRTATVHPLVLDEADGMLESECTGGYWPAGLRSRSGRMYFSTVRGVVAVDPRDFGAVSAPPPVLIEEAWLDGRRLSVVNGEVRLPAGSTELEIRYTAFDFAKPARLRFRYRLDDLDAGWTRVGSQRSARFPLLPPGRHRFVLSAASENGIWSEVPAGLDVIVRPHYWQTDWFRALLIAFFMATGAGLAWRVTHVRIRRAQERERLARAELEAQQRRNEVAHLTRVATLGELSSTLAHELSQPLAAILSNAQAAQRFLSQGPTDPGELRDILEDIVADDQRASEVIRRMRRLLKKDTFRPEVLQVNDVVDDAVRLMQHDLTTRGVNVVTELASGLPAVQADRVQLQQVLINLIYNATDAMVASPASARTLTLRSLETGDGSVHVSVADTGCGLPPGGEEEIFEPYHTSKPEGLGLGLPLSRSLIEALGGRLWAEGRNGGGAILHFTLPGCKSDAR